MTEKEKKQKVKEQPEEASENSVEGTEAFENDEQAPVEIETLQKQLEEAEAKAAENLDGWQRAQAEFINYKNRVQRDREMDYASMKGDIIKNRPEDASWANGMDLIVRKFQNILEAEGVKRIEAAGQAFDPNFHEAISSEPSEEVESGFVIEVMQNGYMLADRVIRPAIVRVAQ